MKKTYITKLPDKAGAFLDASKIIAKNGGNIVRVSYNKAVDVHTLFIEVSGNEVQIAEISDGLKKSGYLLEQEAEQEVILIELTVEDVPGAVASALEILHSFEINISYISSKTDGTGYQAFKMGLLVENAKIIKQLLDKLSEICAVKILEYNANEKVLDTTVFYLSFANDMRRLLGLTQAQTNKVIINSNRIMQMLDEKGESPFKTFEYIRKFARLILTQKDANFNASVSVRRLTPDIKLYMIEPPCGSNTFILENAQELLFIDGGFACYKAETLQILNIIFPDFKNCNKSIAITHADMDHVGLLDEFGKVYLSKNCYENFILEHENKPNFREQNPLHAPYSKIARIITEYVPPKLDNMCILGEKSDEKTLSKIGNLKFGEINIDVFEGNGGHVRGETVYVCEELRLVFSGDRVVNIKGFSDSQMQFNMIAPYLMTSVNIDSEKARKCRNRIMHLFKGYIICPGHGAIM